MNSPQGLAADDFYAEATTPTSNEMFDNGAWLAPVLESRNPELDPRAKHAIHYFAEDARLSVCGVRFGPDHYVETFMSDEETRRRCLGCTQILAAVTSGQQASKVPKETPMQDEYTAAQFGNLIQGTKRIRMRVNRKVSIGQTLYLLVDHGFVNARSLRRDLKRDLATTDTVVLIWAGDSAIALVEAEKARAAAEQLESLRLQEEFRAMVAPVIAGHTGSDHGPSFSPSTTTDN